MKQKTLFPGTEQNKPNKGGAIREWRVPSFTSDLEYLVRQEGKRWMCSCPSKKKPCKHVVLIKERLGLAKPDLSGLKSAIQKSVRRGDLSLLKLSFSRLWELDRRWILWRLPIICAEESERFTGLSGRVETREQAWNLLSSMTLSPKSKEAEGLRICSHIITEEGWNSEDWVSGERHFQLKAWMDVQSRFQAAGKDKKAFWLWFEDQFQVPALAPYVRETIYTAKRRSGMGGMIGDVELLICIAWMCTIIPWPEPEQVQVPAESEIQEAPAVSWFCYDGHTSLGRLVHSQLRKVILDKQGWKYVTDDLQFNQESAKVDRLDESSFWWPLALKMIWKRYGKTEEEAQMDWLKWAPRVQKMIEEQIGGKDAKV